MMDPNHVIVHCPNGHELQAAREHLTTSLSCPMCGVEFVPQGSEAPVAGLPATVAPLGYAGSDLLSNPVKYPSYTSWMLGLWIVGFAFQGVQSAIAAAGNSQFPIQPGQTQNINVGLIAIGGLASCLGSVAIIVAVVLQLMWIYRIHQDAKRARQYAAVSPGLALGISFIIFVNYVWTAWTMKKLSSFVAASVVDADTPTSNRVSKSENATRVLFIASIIIAVTGCIGLSYVMTLIGGAIQGAFGPGGQFDQVKYQEGIKSAIPGWYQIGSAILWLAGVVLYFNAVRKLEDALYPFLGAPPK